MEILIEDYLSSIKGLDLVYVPNPGNGGDSIIASGTYLAFDKVGLEYTLFKEGLTDVKNSILIYGGGGNLVRPTTFSARFIGRYHRQPKRFVLLPHTIKEVDALLGDMGSNVDLICREPRSYEYAKTKAPKANVFLARDMAFALDARAFLKTHEAKLPYHIPGYILKRYLQKQLTPSWTEFGRMLTYERRYSEAQSKIINGELQAFRLDGESAQNGKMPPHNIDLSDTFTFGATTREAADLTTYLLLSILNQCKTVHTDRLHIAIAAALLGINVDLHANNYFKIREIYLYSLAGKYPNVNWNQNKDILF